MFRSAELDESRLSNAWYVCDVRQGGSLYIEPRTQSTCCQFQPNREADTLPSFSPQVHTPRPTSHRHFCKKLGSGGTLIFCSRGVFEGVTEMLGNLGSLTTPHPTLNLNSFVCASNGRRLTETEIPKPKSRTLQTVHQETQVWSSSNKASVCGMEKVQTPELQTTATVLDPPHPAETKQQ